jgi:hypothetical protein
MLLRATLITLFCLHPVLAQTETEAAEVKPSVKKIDETRYQVGDVSFDSKKREIRFPSIVNMAEGLLEYIIVHENGKVHESLLSTKISATHLNLAFTLLRFSPSRELIPLPNATGGTSGNFPEVPADIKAAARVIIEVEWKQDDQVRRVPINDWIQHSVKATSMPHGPWVYGGSDFHDGVYVAELSGDIASIFLSPASILQYPGEDYADDTVWIPFPKRVPAVGTAVTVIITPQQASKLLPAP